MFLHQSLTIYDVHCTMYLIYVVNKIWWVIACICPVSPAYTHHGSQGSPVANDAHRWAHKAQVDQSLVLVGGVELDVHQDGEQQQWPKHQQPVHIVLETESSEVRGHGQTTKSYCSRIVATNRNWITEGNRLIRLCSMELMVQSLFTLTGCNTNICQCTGKGYMENF